MEVLVLFGLIAAGAVAFALALKASFWILAFVVLPLFWVWMLIDAIVRREADYPSGSTNEKVLWIVLILVVQPAVIIYWFLVHRAARRGQASSARPGSVQPSAGAPTPPPAA